MTRLAGVSQFSCAAGLHGRGIASSGRRRSRQFFFPQPDIALDRARIGKLVPRTIFRDAARGKRRARRASGSLSLRQETRRCRVWRIAARFPDAAHNSRNRLARYLWRSARPRGRHASSSELVNREWTGRIIIWWPRSNYPACKCTDSCTLTFVVDNRDSASALHVCFIWLTMRINNSMEYRENYPNLVRAVICYTIDINANSQRFRFARSGILVCKICQSAKNLSLLNHRSSRNMNWFEREKERDCTCIYVYIYIRVPGNVNESGLTMCRRSENELS